jgi:hypothetical protein
MRKSNIALPSECKASKECPCGKIFRENKRNFYDTLLQIQEVFRTGAQYGHQEIVYKIFMNIVHAGQTQVAKFCRILFLMRTN